MTEQFCLKWNNYQLSLTTAFKHILEEEDFVDVTLSAGGQSLKGHKVDIKRNLINLFFRFFFYVWFLGSEIEPI